MRIQIKGGIWKNTEDEILKAAVMKYGLNQWARISSLLVRKSAKQCKARWFEWLDPAIKKTEWTREEDEKLLHLAKLMPTQWRTIAPIVGRTPAQCLDRYERLLDMAVSKEDKYDPGDDPRRLRPGEIDPNPESKPAKPDPIDMDEEEKEMLAEARARMANTKGKKAKRKAREKQMEEARRLASLQKQRELKAAGIEIAVKERRKRAIDYSKEVAFERKPAAGFFDTAEEQVLSKEMATEFRPVTLQELEGRRRDTLEEQLIKRDIKRQKMAEAHDLPAAVAKAAAVNDPVMVRRKGRMMLPAPQVSEAELEAIAKMSTEALLDEELAADGAGGQATRQLLGSYGPTPLRPTAAGPSATPRTAPSGDRIMMEAQNLAKLQKMATPLVGGENPDLHDSDFSGITPRPTVAATPNPLLAAATPGHVGASAALALAPPSSVMRRQGSGAVVAGVAATPLATPSRSGGGGVGATPLQTPIRDALGLNDVDQLASYGTAALSKRAERLRLAGLRAEVRVGLGALPVPQNEYQVVDLEVPGGAADEGEEEDEERLEEDASEVRARRQHEEEARREEEEKKKSKALQRRLPRPPAVSLPEPAPASELPKLSWRERSEDLVLREITALLRHDTQRYPLPPSGKEGKEARKAAKAALAAAALVPPLEELPPELLQSAARLLEDEVTHVRSAMGHADTDSHVYHETFQAVYKEVMWAPDQKAYVRASTATPQQFVDSAKSEYEAALSEMQQEAKRAAKLEQKVGVLLTGLQQRDGRLRKQVEEAWDALLQARSELLCFQVLHEREQHAAPERIERMLELVRAQLEREGELQLRYKGLLREQQDLLEHLTTATV